MRGNGQNLPLPLQKIAPDLVKKIAHLSPGDSATITVAVRLTGNPQDGLFERENDKAIGYPGIRFYQVRLSKKTILSLADQKEVLFISERQTPKEELNTGAVDYTLNRINQAHWRFPNIKGDSIFISIKERAFDSTDIDLKGRVFSSGLSATLQTSHASSIATIIAGAGNSSPFARGVASGAFVNSVDFLNLFPETDSFYQQKKISVVNHSYGTVVENFYGNEAAAFDASATNNPTVIQIFSAGNSGTATPTSGIYNGLAGIANLTGNFKQAKNVIAVAALDSAGAPMAAASRGPAYDGRLKPELSAYGEDGSSGAAALVSGAAALVQDAYKKGNGILPSSDLVKAVLINSAGDVGQAGIDYLTGYGSLDAQKAVETILQNRFFQSTVVQGEIKTFLLTVPPNIEKLKLTLTWRDVAALPNATKALVNDLDLQLKDTANSTSWLPWVLNPLPNLATLQSPATRKADTLNTVEQITVDSPVAGEYKIEVKGTKLLGSSQSFSLAYQFDTAAAFAWSFPSSIDPLIAARTQWLRWQTTFTGLGQIEYATANNNWQIIGTVPDLSTDYFKWTLPDTNTIAVLRMKLPNGTAVLSDTFAINRPLNLQAGFDCKDSFLLHWNALPGVSYRIAELSGNYLQVFRQQTDSSALLYKAQHPSTYYAVIPVVNGKNGLQSQTINYVSSGVGCYIKSFFLQTQTTAAAFFTAEAGSLYNVQEVSFERLTPSGFVAVKTIASPNSLVFSFADSSLAQGINLYRFKVKLTNGVVLYSNTEVVYYLPQRSVVFYPNPVRQGDMLTVLAKEVGRYSLQVFDAAGKFLHSQALNSGVARLNITFTAKGIYFIRITDTQGKSSTEKLTVY